MGRKCIDLTGQKFGRLTVIERVENKGKRVAWLCQCECGNEKVIVGQSLKSGNTMSCGCTNEVEDLTGQKFGRLTVIERAENKGKKVAWLCQCECGNEKVIRGCSLKNGDTISCGCLQNEKSSERIKQKWQDEDFRKMQKEKMKEKWQDEDFKKMQSEKSSERMKGQWQDEEMKWKMGYKGGITPITQYLRSSNSQWFEDCKQKANYTCQLTGKHGGNLHTHHLKAFNTIVIEAHKLHNIQFKDQVKDYTQEELKLLEEYVGSWHKDSSNAVVLSEDAHNLFHKLYGKGENTPEQYMEFKERYLAGEFKEILK